MGWTTCGRIKGKNLTTGGEGRCVKCGTTREQIDSVTRETGREAVEWEKGDSYEKQMGNVLNVPMQDWLLYHRRWEDEGEEEPPEPFTPTRTNPATRERRLAKERRRRGGDAQITWLGEQWEVDDRRRNPYPIGNQGFQLRSGGSRIVVRPEGKVFEEIQRLVDQDSAQGPKKRPST